MAAPRPTASPMLPVPLRNASEGAGAELDGSLENLIHSVKGRKLEGMVAKRYASGRAGGRNRASGRSVAEVDQAGSWYR